METVRWPNGVSCPLCSSDNVTKMGGLTQAGMFMCNGCQDKFTVRTGTIFERSHTVLTIQSARPTFLVISPNGISNSIRAR